mmetsp:Transcript_122384/g.345970  ORF Transcript_122384/g.345970 Transcript_122384/m.345970 type:complete len:91 (+) Transcript_122384:58-330(+)
MALKAKSAAKLEARIDAIQADIAKLQGKQQDEINAQKDGVSKQIGDQKQHGLEARNELNKMKKSIGYTNEVETDDRIATIEFRQLVTFPT